VTPSTGACSDLRPAFRVLLGDRVIGPRLEEAVALVTGAAGAIGRATCHRLAAAGANVVALDLDGPGAEAIAHEVAARHGRPALASTCDVTDSVAVAAATARAVDRFGHLDVVVTCAGVLRNAPVTEMEDGDFDEVVDVHLGGTFKVVRAAVPHLRQGSSIVTVSSGAAWGSTRGHSNYSAAKASIHGLTRTLALELAPHTRVNAVAPGAIESRMTRETAAQLGIDMETYRRRTAARVPLARIGQPEDVADVICFLASSMARYVTGQVLKVGGAP